MLTTELVEKVRKLWDEGKTHGEIITATGIPREQEFAIISKGQQLSAKVCATRASNVTPGMKSVQISAIMLQG